MIDPDKTRALGLLAETVDDLERTRIALDNRLRAAEKDIKALGLIGPLIYSSMIELAALVKVWEKDAVKDLQKMMKQHDLAPWVEENIGIGYKQGARLIAAIGDPAYNEAEGRFRRGPAELWAYAGYHVINGKRPRRQKGVQSNWNPTAKMRARLVAESCRSQRHSPYRPVYEKAKADWADRDVTKGHRDNHALAVTAKAILKDLYLYSRGLRDG